MRHYICDKQVLFIVLFSDIFTCFATAITNPWILGVLRSPVALHRIAVRMLQDFMELYKSHLGVCLIFLKNFSLCHNFFTINITKAILTKFFQEHFLCPCDIHAGLSTGCNLSTVQLFSHGIHVLQSPSQRQC